VFKLNEKVQALEAERQMLHSQLQQQHHRINDSTAMQERKRMSVIQLSATTPERVPKLHGLGGDEKVHKEESVEDERTLTDITML